ncbi:MAG: transposase [Acidobacteriaceae bacterium]|nr:transposase [Acidobacteriaceae bacterium]
MLSYLHYLPPHRTRLSSNNPIERMKLEIRRCTRVVGISPHPRGLPAADRDAAGGNP